MTRLTAWTAAFVAGLVAGALREAHARCPLHTSTSTPTCRPVRRSPPGVTTAQLAYAIWDRSLEDAVMGTYAQSTLSDSRARTLADQGEAAMRARHFSEAHTLFVQALTFQPGSTYLQDRIGAAQRAVDKYGG